MRKFVSSNEELQSINEELETSKEEIESANEELTTINNELEIRNDQLSEAQEYAQSIFSTIREAVVVLDSSFRVRNANQAFYDIFKVKEQDTEGVLIYELGNRQWDILQLRQLLEVLIPKNSSFTDFEVEHEFPEIGHKIMLINARAILKRNSNDQLILLAIEDITEHRKAAKLISERESWFRTMANQAPVLIWVVGTDKNKRFFNETWLEFTGSSVSEVTGTGWTNQIHSDDIQRYLKIFHEHFDQRLPFSLEYRLKRADGDFRWIFEIAKPTFNDEGHFSGYIGSCTEIHDKKLLQEELEQRVQQRTYELQHANMELHRSNKELQQFAYVASHDLQEPLRKILTFADRLQHLQNSFPDTATPYLAKIVDSSQRMRKLIDALLNFSKTSLKKLNYEKVDLNIILKTVLTDFELIINEKDAIINFDTLPTIEAIPIQMEQLFHNMISNGLKFSKKDTQPIIDITVKSPSADDLSSYGLNGKMQYCEIIFSDNGIGFEPEYAEQIFEIFHRLNYKQDYPGTGIGLALCRKIISNHKGRIIAKGVENQGASFHIILPFSV